jgi:hypothetical protein
MAIAMIGAVAGASLATLSAGTFAWPIQDPSLAGNFASASGGGFLTGLSFAGAGRLVTSMADGELIYSYSADPSSSQIPSGLGNHAILRHSNDYYALYGRLQAEVAPGGQVAFAAGEALGLSGDGTLSYAPGLLLMVIDKARGHYVNPSVLLPPLADIKQPLIRSVSLIDAKGKELALPLAAPVDQGEYLLVADLGDQSTAATAPSLESLQVHSLAVRLNGRVAASMSFDTMRIKDGRKRAPTADEAAFEAFYDPRGRIRVAKLSLLRGAQSLELRVQDFSRNERSFTATFQVK